MGFKLFMVLLGCRPKGRNTEQHDTFFDIGENLAGIKPAIKKFWPEVASHIHIDAWREVLHVDGHEVAVTERTADNAGENPDELRLFFINLGGYVKDQFEELHHQVVVAAHSKMEAIKKAKQTIFFKQKGFPGASAHIDDKYGLDVDDLYLVQEILSETAKNNFTIKLTATKNNEPDVIHLGYLPLNKI